MTATVGMWYSDPNVTVIRQDQRNLQVAATGIQAAATFRSRLKAVVTGVHAQVTSAATGSHILTLLVNGSVAAILTLGNTANENGPHTFTLSTNRTLNNITDRIQIAVPTHATGNLDVVYEYYLVPQDATTFGKIS